jgi:hypothetical protein
MSKDGIKDVRLTIHDKTDDQNERFSCFLYFEGYNEDGLARDYESLDGHKIPTLNQLQRLHIWKNT